MNMLHIAAALCLVLSSSVAAAGVGQPPDGFVRLYGELGDVPCRPGRPIVLVFFTTACPTCWDDLFEVRFFIEEQGLEFELVGVTRDSESAVRAFLGKYGFPGPVVRDARKRLFRAYAVEAEPFTVVINDGRVVYRDDSFLGFKSRREELKKWMMRHAGRFISA